MAVFRDIGDLNFKNTVVAIGNFDGVHCGHQLLLRRLVDLAAQQYTRSVVLTFWPHPRQILRPDDSAPLLLNTIDEKTILLNQTGVDDVVVFPFDRVLSQMSASDFIKDIIIGKLNASHMVVGQDHQFGKNRNGTVQQLSEYTSQNDLSLEVVDLKTLDRKISSSYIRQLLSTGDLSLANKMLGYEYRISGKVIAGNHLGSTIGFPTANLETYRYKLLPKEGVYRVKVKTDIDRSDRLGMLFIGKQSVLKQESETTQIEVNIFDFDRQIYGQNVELALTHRIRDNIRFENIGQLAAQLHRDKQNILNISS